MVRNSDIIEGPIDYQLGRHSYKIRKHSGRGRVLSKLLKNRGDWIKEPVLGRIGDWSNPRRRMSELIREVNKYSRDYHIEEMKDDSMSLYRIKSVRK